MRTHLRPAIVSLAVLTVICGGLYPLLVTGAARLLFPRRAAGSLVERSGKAVGSSLIGQPFDEPKYFWGRLSATSPVPYTAFNADKSAGSSGSNLGPLNPALKAAAEGRIRALRASDPDNPFPIPGDLVTASGSGLDPHISPAAAAWQVPRVARARRMSEESVRALVSGATERPQLGLLGEERVNVLMLNLALDAGREAAK